jgi:16S rRNA (cytosine967-C5)-methyltransferase
MPAISSARHAALLILLNIERGNGHSDDLLRDDKSLARMNDADRRLATALVLGVLRWQLQLDQKIRAQMSKPNAKLDPAVLVALRLGAFQLLHLDRIPAHAAINESVELVKRSGYRSAAGLVNAVLRKLALAPEDTFSASHSGPPALNADGFSPDAPVLKGHDFSRAADPQPSTRALAPEGCSSPAVAAHPAWIVDRWTNLFGAETACAICIHDQGQPSTTIRLSNPAVELELAEAGVTLAPAKLLTAARVVQSGDVTATAAFRERRMRMQDEGSQLVGEIAAHAVVGSKKILDCCAAPGGKTLILTARNPAAHIVACEASPPRLEQLRARLADLAERVECRLADATQSNLDAEFDVVLADVPCSGTGTLSRNPEIRYRLKPEDFARQAERQRAILTSALRAVRPGGCVVYSTCSLEPEEDEEVLRAVVESDENAHILPLGPLLDGLRERGIVTAQGAEKLRTCVTPEFFLRLMPDAFGTDGFFVAMIRKSE